MFAPKTSAPSAGGLTINTNSTNSLFGNNTQNTSTSTLGGGNTGGGLFGNTASTQNKPAGGLFGGGNTAQSQNTGSSMFSGLGNTQQNSTAGTGGSLFGKPATTTTTQPASGGLFGTAGAGTGTGAGTTQAGSTGGGLFGGASNTTAAPAANTGGGLFGGASSTNPTPAGNTGGGLFGGAASTSTTQAGTTGGGLFGGGLGSTTQTQAKPTLGLGTSTTGGGGLFGGGSGGATQNTQQQQPPQKPTLSLFGNPGTTQGTQQPLQQSVATGTVAPGVTLNLDELLPTTKFESCAEQVRKGIENIDNYILEQMKLCNEVSDMLPTIESQGSTIPNDVDFVQSKLETIQHALENDAEDIDQLRGLVTRDAAEAQVAFRAIDTLKLPLQYQSAGGNGWWSQDQKVPDRRSTRKNTLALPDDVEADPATATAVHGVPVNLVDYFSQRSDEMGGVLNRYKGNLKEIEDHLHGVELTLNRQISEFVSSRSRDSAGPRNSQSTVNDLAAVLGDVEAGILGVANRLGGVSEQVQEVTLGPLANGEGRLGL